ncbi:MAG: response regulator [Candidatus Latescibacterota bacterium]
MVDIPRILIVDDDPDFVEATKAFLETKPYQVLTASNREECLRNVKEESPDLIILDVMMKHMDSGFDICRTLKEDPQFAHIPILMITGVRERVGFDFMAEAVDEDWLPADDYVPKPVKSAELLRRVDALIKASAA